CVRQARQRGDLRLAEPRPFPRQVQAAVGRQAGERDAFEVERGSAAAGGYVFHRGCAVSGGSRGWQASRSSWADTGPLPVQVGRGPFHPREALVADWPATIPPVKGWMLTRRPVPARPDRPPAPA